MKRLAAFAFACMSAWAAAGAPVTTPPEHVRGTEQTYLTFPEWFLVFSPEEYARFAVDRRPSEFPFMGHVAQFWSSYRVTGAAANDGYPLNIGYHVMIMVIGASTTVEYALRGAYETIFGRIAEATAGGATSEEDRFAARVAREYVDFIVVQPWYDFDFSARLKKLWTEVPLTGPHMMRKWERRYALTTEYGIKAVYAWLIGKGTHASYDAPILSTAAIVVPAGKDDPELMLMPRYQAFMDAAGLFAKTGGRFDEIAGNRSVILVSALAPRDWRAPESLRFFEQPIITRPAEKRVVLRVPVADLANELRTLPAQGVRLEHVFDY